MIKILITLADTLFLLRFPLLAPVWTILILGWIIGSDGARVGSFSYGGLFVTLSGFSLLVASIYVVNQIRDIESDRINRKLFILPDGIISVPAAWVIAALCAAGGLAVSLIQGALMFALFASGLIVGILYNLPPASLKDRPVGGVAANALGHGVITFLAGWLSAKGGGALAPELMAAGLLSSLAAGFANGAVFLVTTIPDAGGDARTGKRTFCVAYGPKAASLAAAAMCALALASSFLMENCVWVMAVPAALSMGIFLYAAVTAKTESAFYAFKWPVFLLTVFVTLFVPVYIGLILFTFIASRIYYKYRFGIIYPTFSPK
jgi:4-hydroxybenzoate polyprenyltransferase